MWLWLLLLRGEIFHETAQKIARPALRRFYSRSTALPPFTAEADARRKAPRTSAEPRRNAAPAESALPENLAFCRRNVTCSCRMRHKTLKNMQKAGFL